MGLRRTRVRLISAVIMAVIATMTSPAYAEKHTMSDNLLKVGDSVVKRIMPKPESDSMYVATDYTEIHFEINKAKLDNSYMDNGLALLNQAILKEINPEYSSVGLMLKLKL